MNFYIKSRLINWYSWFYMLFCAIIILRLEVTKMAKGKGKDKCLFACESKIDVNDYKKMARYFPQVYWSYVRWGTSYNIIISLIIAILYNNSILTLIFLVVFQIFLMILFKVRLEYFVEKSFNNMKESGMFDTDFYSEFYEYYLTRQGNSSTLKIYYCDIDRCVETDTSFYLKDRKKNVLVTIQKSQCDLDLINFIRSTFKNLENYLGDTSDFKRVKRVHDPNFIKNGLMVLFVITIASLWGALYSCNLLDEVIPPNDFNFAKNMWVFWCWLPIPILSIILGFIYKSAGYKCTKNIVGGFIIGFLLLVFGAFSIIFSPIFTSDNYSKIFEYKNIIDANIPNNGDLEIKYWGTYFDQDKTEYVIINAYYDKKM